MRKVMSFVTQIKKQKKLKGCNECFGFSLYEFTKSITHLP